MNFFLLSLIAALPPLAQSSREMKAILSDKQLYETLTSGEPIEEIKREDGGYLVTTPKHTIWVEVQYRKTEGKIGPVEFDLVFHPSSVGNRRP